MKTLFLTISIIALSTTALLAQDKKATTKQVKHTPDSGTKAKKATDTNQTQPEDRNPEIFRNKKMKHHTDLINVPEK